MRVTDLLTSTTLGWINEAVDQRMLAYNTQVIKIFAITLCKKPSSLRGVDVNKRTATTHFYSLL